MKEGGSRSRQGDQSFDSATRLQAGDGDAAATRETATRAGVEPATRAEAAPEADALHDVASAVTTVSCELRGLEALRDALAGSLGEQFSRAVQVLAGATGRVIVTGVGKSGHVARKIAATLASTGKPAHFVHPSDASHGDLGMVRPEDAVLAMSWSGETAELADLIVYTRRFRVPLLASTSRAGSTLARAADVALILPETAEACADSLAPTTSTTMQMALGDALAVALLARRGFSQQEFRELHPGGRLGARLQRVQDLMHRDGEVPTVPETATLADAIVRMTSGRFGITGVVDEAGLLVGVITDGDLRRVFERGFAQGMERGMARETMGRSPRTIAPGELATAALARMHAEAITSLFAVEEGRAVGIVHIHDLLRAGLV